MHFIFPTGSSEVYELDEGDILFFPIETSHEVWSEGPRTGLLVNADSQKDLAKYIGL
jgi:quercetin dioxygenase-like cupin family protein